MKRKFPLLSSIDIEDVDDVWEGTHIEEFSQHIADIAKIWAGLFRKLKEHPSPKQLDFITKYFLSNIKNNDVVYLFVKDLLHEFKTEEMDEVLFYKSDEFNELLRKHNNFIYGDKTNDEM